MRRCLPLALLILLAPATAHAGSVTFGSDLTAPATTFESSPVDSAYWNTKLASGARVRSPAKGEVSIVKLKGRINKPSENAAKPNVVLHVQVLRRTRGEKRKVMVTSGNLKLPFGGRVDRVTTYNLQRMPARICVKKGDYIALSTSGGFGPEYPDGAQFQMFGDVAGSAFRGMTGQGKDMDGDVFTGKERANRELLMQTSVATGNDARPFCR